MQVHEPTGERLDGRQLELEVDAGGEGGRPAPDGHRGHEEVHLVDQAGRQRLAASAAPPIDRSCGEDATRSATTSGSKVRSIRVLGPEATSRVVEYTILSAARHNRVKSASSGGSPSAASNVSQKTIDWYIRRPYR